MSHILRLQVQDDLRDSRFMLVHDRSEYDKRLPLDNRAFYARVPGFDDDIPLLFSVDGTTLLNSVKLQLSETYLETLPDGLYTFTYSIAPNNQIYTVNYYFRCLNLQTRICEMMMRRVLDNDTVITHMNGGLQHDIEERLLIRSMTLLNCIQIKVIKNDIDYNNALLTYNEIERLLNHISNTHV